MKEEETQHLNDTVELLEDLIRKGTCFEVLLDEGIWCKVDSYPTKDSIIENWRVAEKSKDNIVDLSVFIGSDIDMEFSNNEFKTTPIIGKLRNITGGKHKYISGAYEFEQCRIRENHWNVWLCENECPLTEGVRVDMAFSDGGHECDYDYTLEDRWGYLGDDDGIFAFKVTGLRKGYRYEWEE